MGKHLGASGALSFVVLAGMLAGSDAYMGKQAPQGAFVPSAGLLGRKILSSSSAGSSCTRCISTSRTSLGWNAAPRTTRRRESASIFSMKADFLPPFLGAIDQGTQSSRFMIFDARGDVVATTQLKHTQITPNPGWCEHDPEEITAKVRECIDGTMAKFYDMGYSKGELKAVGITNQRETTVVWDKESGKPLHNAVVWLDTRTTELCKKLSDEHGGSDAFREVCGLPISTYFSGVKLRWLLDKIPAVRKAADEGRAKFGTIDTWLLHSLAGVHVTDPTNAARTMLMDLKTCRWSEDTCKAFDIPTSMLPEIKSSAEVYGHIKGGSLDGVPIAACLGDQQSALVGHAALTTGEGKVTYGTGAFMLLNTGTEPVQSKNGLLTTVGYQLGPKSQVKYALEGSVAVAGVGVSWLIDNMELLKDPKESEAIARTVEDTGGVYFVPAFSGLFAPHWRDDARGVIVGLSQFSKRAHIVRALLEAVCFQVKDVDVAMSKDSGLDGGIVRVDGGMTANSLLMQTQADFLGKELQVPEMAEVTALGCALAAGLGVGAIEDEAALKQLHKEHKTYQIYDSSISEKERSQRFDRWGDALKRTLNWVGPGSTEPK